MSMKKSLLTVLALGATVAAAAQSNQPLLRYLIVLRHEAGILQRKSQHAVLPAVHGKNTVGFGLMVIFPPIRPSTVW